MFPALGLHGDASCGARAAEFLAAHPRRPLRAGRAGGTPLIALARALQQSPPIPERQIQRARKAPGSSAKHSRASWKARIRRNFRWTEKIGFVAQGIATRRNLRTGQAGERFALETIRRAPSRQSDVKALLARETEGIAEPSAAHSSSRTSSPTSSRSVFSRASSSRSPPGTSSRRSRRSACSCRSSRRSRPYIYAFRSQAPDRALARRILPRAHWRATPRRSAKPQARVVHRYAGGRQRRGEYDPRLTAAVRRRGARPDGRHVARTMTRSPASRSRISRRSANSSCRSTNCRSSASRRFCRCSTTSSAKDSPS